MMGYGYGMLGGFGMIIPLILIGLVVYAAVNFSQNNHKNYNNSRSENDALDILNRRYANGEISEEEYMKKKKMLRD
jgi:putative membrane protein